MAFLICSSLTYCGASDIACVQAWAGIEGCLFLKFVAFAGLIYMLKCAFISHGKITFQLFSHFPEGHLKNVLLYMLFGIYESFSRMF